MTFSSKSNIISSCHIYQHHKKKKVDRGLIALNLSEIKDSGGLNYAIHQIIAEYISQNKESYQTYNDIIGALECAKMELYRRLISEYEDKKDSSKQRCKTLLK